MGRKKPCDPRSPEEWQGAVDMAAFLRIIEDCRMYGLVTGGPKVDISRCDDILEKGKRRGVVPAPPDQLIARFKGLL